MGSVVTGVIDKVTASSVIVYVNAKDYLKGTIATEHLSDHHGIDLCFVYMAKIAVHVFQLYPCLVFNYAEHAALMKSVLKPGYKFDQLLVLGIFLAVPFECFTRSLKLSFS